MRQLASVQQITSLSPINGADKIEVAQVLGWQCVVKKGEFQVGDMIVYVEVDSILPAKPEFEFLKDRKYRVKTIKLRGQISQGLVLPMSVLGGNEREWKAGLIGTDVTDALGVIKYDPQAASEAEVTTKNVSPVIKFMRRFAWYRKLFPMKKTGDFPSWIAKTDETRIQNFPHICEKEKGTSFEVTEKLDGQSATFYLRKTNNWFGKKYEFGVCSREHRVPTTSKGSWWKVAKQYEMKDKLKLLIGNLDYIVIQGEIVGEGIQKNKYGIKGYEFYAFNLITPDGRQSWAWMDNLISLAGIKSVPLIGIFELPDTIQEAVNLSVGLSKLNDKIQREGMVWRNAEKGLSFKVINPEFLLKNDE